MKTNIPDDSVKIVGEARSRPSRNKKSSKKSCIEPNKYSEIFYIISEY